MEIAVLATLAGKEECADESLKPQPPGTLPRHDQQGASYTGGVSSLHPCRVPVRASASPSGLASHPPDRPTSSRWLSAARVGSQGSRLGKAYHMPDATIPVRAIDRPWVVTHRAAPAPLIVPQSWAEL